MTEDGLDRLLRDSAPEIDEDRVECLTRAVLYRQAQRLVQPVSWFGWLTARRGVAFLGLFLLGCALNLATRQAAMTPLDLLLPPSVQLPWSGL